MPIYEYSCAACNQRFEMLVRGDSKPACPACGARSVKRLLSVVARPAGGSGGPDFSGPGPSGGDGGGCCGGGSCGCH